MNEPDPGPSRARLGRSAQAWAHAGPAAVDSAADSAAGLVAGWAVAAAAAIRRNMMGAIDYREVI